MIDDIEISKSDRARCCRCGNKIGLKTPRGIRLITQNYGNSKVYYCYKCAGNTIDINIIDLKELKKELKKMIKKNQPAIILEELEKDKMKVD